MGSVNIGRQTIIYDYLQSALSQGFNRLNHKIFSQGIIEGGEITRNTNIRVEVDPFIALLRDDSNEVTVRIETNSIIYLTIYPTTPYIIIRYEWQEGVVVFADILVTAKANIGENDLILGKAVYNSGATDIVDIDYSEKNWHPFTKLSNDNTDLMIVANDVHTTSDEDKVTVLAGSAYINNKYVEISDTLSATITTPGIGMERYDLISLDEDGNVNVTEGAESATPTIPDFPEDELVLGYLTLFRPTSDTFYIRGNMITNLEYTHYYSKEGQSAINTMIATLQADIDSNDSDISDIYDQLNQPTNEGKLVFFDGSGGLENKDYVYAMPKIIGETVNISSTAPNITKLDAMTFAYTDRSNDELRTYGYNGIVWTQKNPLLSIPNMDLCAITAINDVDIAWLDTYYDELRTYRRGTSVWSQVGNGLDMSEIINTGCSLCTLDTNLIVFAHHILEEIRTYSWDGVDWSQVGNSFPLPSPSYGTIGMTALSTTQIAFIDPGNRDLRFLQWDETDWSQIGSSLNVPGASGISLATLNSTDISFYNGSADSISVYRWDTSTLTWSQVSEELIISGIPSASTTALGNNTIAVFDYNDDVYTIYFPKNLY